MFQVFTASGVHINAGNLDTAKQFARTIVEQYGETWAEVRSSDNAVVYSVAPSMCGCSCEG